MRKKYCLFIVLLMSLFYGEVYSQTTGKIAGKVVDKESGEPLPGAQVVVKSIWFDDVEVEIDSKQGGITDLNGEFFILNVSPGEYSIEFLMMGYEKLIMKKVAVSINRTTNLPIELSTTVIEGEEVIVEASLVSIKKDKTSSIKNISGDQIESLPVENMQSVINMQAGVVNGHFRGGRLTDVSFMIDGVQVDESFEKTGRIVELENDAIQDIEIITGTFNAEYGRAMSGVVNAVTKDGGNDFHGKVSASLANYFTNNDEIFIGLKSSELNRNQDYRIQLEGPVLKNKLTFFTNYRIQDNKNYLNGIHRFNPDDYSDYTRSDSSSWYSEKTGDGEYVPLAFDKQISFLGKLTYKASGDLRFSLNYILNDFESAGYRTSVNGNPGARYSHAYKYNPHGMANTFNKTHLLNFLTNHTISRNIFHEMKLSYTQNDNSSYVFESPEDAGYVHDAYYRNSGTGFLTGGQNKNYFQLKSDVLNIKYDLNWQINSHNGIKTGFLWTQHKIDHKWYSIRNAYFGLSNEYESYYDQINKEIVFPNYKPVLPPDTLSSYSDVYSVEPKEISCYIQDKIEFNELVINLGVRYDYFDPNTIYPSQWRNPSNQLTFIDSTEKMSTYLDSDKQYQISPRLGLSYQLSNTAILHFSYGHFFQIPPFYALYKNRSFLVSPNDYDTEMGNPQLEAEKTVQYEIGIWQELMKGMGLEINLYYRDIYNLLSTKIISTFNQIEYGLYTNKDYGNVKGLELKFDYRYLNYTIMANYTLQYSSGNADNPLQTFTRAGDSMDPISTLIPMSWDQRHTFNLSFIYQAKKLNLTFTGYYESGTAYTWSPIPESRLYTVNLYPNNAHMPMRYSADLNSSYDIEFVKGTTLRLMLSIYNIFDRKNEIRVNGQTGKAYSAIVRPSDISSHHSDFNTYNDRYQDPSMYDSPRMIKFGLAFVF